jgi:non-ribosomal peptide synthetase component F
MDKLTNLQFLDLLYQKNIQISIKDERLQISAPTGVLDAQLRAELARRKPDLLAFLEKTKASTEFIAPRAKDAVRIPQTPIQQGFWLIDHYQPGNVAYNIPEAFLLETPADIGVLQKAVNELLRRHEILRTSFHEQDGDLFQSVSVEAPTVVGSTDLSSYPEAECHRELQRLIREQARQPFDLKQPPLIRFHLFLLDHQRSVFFLNIHHIIADRKSVNILYEELMALYRARAENKTADLPLLSVQYADYALWAANQMNTELIEKQLRYWKRKLAGIPPFLELPHSRPYPQTRTSWGATIPLTIPASLQDSLKKIGREESATPFMTFLAAFAMLLYIYSGSEDFCIGSPATLRKQASMEQMVGVFVNMLTFRCQPTQENNFRKFVRQIRNTALEAYDNSDLPFQKLVSSMKPDRRSQRSPVFQILFGFEPYVQRTGQIAQIDTEPGTARYDLTLNLAETGAGISGSIEYCTDIFDEGDIRKLIQGLSMVEAIALEPNRQLSEFMA